MRPILAWLAAGLLVLLCGSSAAQPLPGDERVVTGRLESGLSYVLRRHDNPPGRVSLWLHVSAGSLNEPEHQRGIAHFLEHLAFNGSANFPPGTVVPFFEDLGMTFGRHQNAFTSFDQTVYQIDLPDTKPETIHKGLLFLSDVAGRLLLLPDEIDKERQIILEEKRARAGAFQRVSDEVFDRLAPGSLLSARRPIGLEETIAGVQREDFVEFYTRWYVPSNMTLVIVADAAPEDVLPLVREAFADARPAPMPADPDVGFSPETSSRAIVATDPELVAAQVSMTRLEAGRGPVDTEAERRVELVESIAWRVVNRRLGRLVADGSASFRRASVSAGDLPGGLRQVEASASGEPDRWRQMLTDLVTEVRRASRHGVTPRELEDARKDLLATFERAAETEPTLSARALVGMMTQRVHRGEPIRSAAQELELVRRVLPGITVQDVSAALSAALGSPAWIFVAQLPEADKTGGTPGEPDLLRLGEELLRLEPDAPSEGARAESLLDSPPAPGEVTELTQHARSGVTSAWLSNGVRVHHRFMDYKKDEVTLTVLLAGGEILESAADRGITSAAAQAWQRPATSRLTSNDIEDLLTGVPLSVRPFAGADAVGLVLRGRPADLETGLQLAYLMLTDPVLEPANFEQWRQSQFRQIEGRAMTPTGMFLEALLETLYPPEEVRQRPVSRAHVEAIRREDAEAWLRRLAREGAMEVSVVGELRAEPALDLVRRYLGAVPARERIGAATLDALRAVRRPRGPLATQRPVATRTPQAVAMAGFFGPDAEQVDDARLMSLAARMLSTRFVRALREEEQLVYSIRVMSDAGTAFPGYGLFNALSTTDPGKADRLADRVQELFEQFARSGPTPEEMEVARRQAANDLDMQMREPAWWSQRLRSLDYRGIPLDAMLDEPAAVQRDTAEGVRDAFNRYHRPENLFRVVVVPAPDQPAPEPAAAPDADRAVEPTPR